MGTNMAALNLHKCMTSAAYREYALVSLVEIPINVLRPNSMKLRELALKSEMWYEA